MNKFIPLLIIFAGCSTAGKGRPIIQADKPPVALQKPQGSQEPQELYGPPLPEGGVPAESSKELPKESPKELTEQTGYLLVLSPGLARSFAHLGVLRVIEEKEIDVRAVYATEIGALCAALWSYSNANKTEWEIFKFKRDDFLDEGGMLGFGRKSSDGKNYAKYLDRVLGGKDLAGGSKKLFFGVSPSDSADRGIEIREKGRVSDVIRASSVFLGLMKPQNLGGVSYKSAALVEPLPVERLKNYNAKTICVDVTGSGDDFKYQNREDEYLSGIMVPVSAMVKSSLKFCDKVIRVNTYGIHYLDFEAKAELIERGRTAAEKVLTED